MKGMISLLAKGIAESGEDYIRYEDGTQICWGRSVVNVEGYGEYGSLYYYSIGNVLQFPASFIEKPFIISTCACNTNQHSLTADLWIDDAGNVNVTGIAASYINGQHTILWLAIGKWR